MIKDIIELITEYITGEIFPEKKYWVHLVKKIKYIFDMETKYYNEAQKRELSGYLMENIRELKEIRDIFLKGKPFVKNCQKGSNKGFRNLTMKILENSLTIDREKTAKEYLEFVKKYRSQRTYYRYLKIIKEMGIEI